MVSPHRRRVLATLAGLVLLAPRAVAHAGGGGQATQADVSVPGWVLWAAGAGLVALSFAVVGLVLTRDETIHATEATPVTAGSVTGLDREWVTLGRIVGLVGFALAVAPSLLPFVDGWASARFVWLGAWTLGPMVAYFGVNWWAIASPFRALAGLADRLRGDSAPTRYPDWLGSWPAVALLLAVFGFEASRGSAFGNAVSLALLGYTAFTMAGMMVFGSRTWLARAEVFDRVFAWWAFLAPIQLTEAGPKRRPPLAGLAQHRAADASDASFFVVLLYGVNFDGFLATEAGRSALALLAPLSTAGARALILVAGFLAFLAVFWATAWAIREAAGSLRDLSRIGERFAVGLLPIAAGYHLAHAGPSLVQGFPLLVEAIGDPLALGATSAHALGTSQAWALVAPNAGVGL